MVMKKKAQAAMEFLMTYGWAILVVLVVIGALAYFGVLNPENLLPEKCTLPMGLYCKEHAVRTGSPGSINFIVENGMGSGVIFRNISVTGDVFDDANCNLDAAGLGSLPYSESPYNSVAGLHIGNGDSKTITIACDIGTWSGKTKGNIKITYCSDTLGDSTKCDTFSRPLEGELMTVVQ